MRMFGRLAVSVFALAAMLSGGVARADNLTLGGTYTTFYINEGSSTNISTGGGSIGPSTLNGYALPWVYCIDLFDDVGVPATYGSTTVTNNGVITSESASAAALGLTSGVVNNAGEVAWLLDHYAAGATSSDAQAALQAALWHVIYGSIIAGSSNDATMLADYNADLTALGSNTAALNTIAWLSPSNGSGPEQGLVTNLPEPSTSSIMFIGLVFLGLMSKRLVRGNYAGNSNELLTSRTD